MSQFSRHRTAFFHRPDIKAALSEIAASEEIIIYCGAGVTIDRTDLNWRGLIERVFDDPVGAASDDPSPEDIRIMMEHEDPQRVASALHYYRQLHDGEKVDEYLVPRIQQHLYRQNGWQEGTLTQNIVRMAYAFAQENRFVTIVTTNYDTYLEDACRLYLSMVEERGGPAVKLVTWTLNGTPREVRRAKDTIRLIYLHGRVPRSGSSTGRLVLSEADYIDTRTEVLATLKSLFSRKRATVLVMGSSLTDPPLVEALGATRRTDSQKNRKANDQEGPVHQSPPTRRYALMPMSSTPYAGLEDASALRLSRHVQARCNLLDLTLLFCDFNFQTGLFCQEVIRAIADGASYPLSDHRYGKLLCDWWKNWSESDTARNADDLYKALREGLSEINTFATVVSRASSSELFKIELWVRRNPSESNRVLALWSSTCGPIYCHETSRHQEISLLSSHVTVRAFIEGRPQYSAVQRHRVDESAKISWKGFVSVPIYVPKEDGFIPVGVVTLASSRDPKESLIQLYQKQMSGLTRHLHRLGLRILSTEELGTRSLDSRAVANLRLMGQSRPV